MASIRGVAIHFALFGTCAIDAEVMAHRNSPEILRLRPQSGDVVEISTPKGLAYFLYTHRHTEPPRWGSVVRVIPGIFTARPTNFEALVVQPPQFITFFPLGSACNRRVVKIVAKVEVPETARAFPTFRSWTPPPIRQRCHHFWDGTRHWKQEQLLPGQEKMPLLQIMNDTMLIQKIVGGWRREQAV
jgi:hypothetical protein